jgi:hypothetical protein
VLQRTLDARQHDQPKPTRLQKLFRTGQSVYFAFRSNQKRAPHPAIATHLVTRIDPGASLSALDDGPGRSP